MDDGKLSVLSIEKGQRRTCLGSSSRGLHRWTDSTCVRPMAKRQYFCPVHGRMDELPQMHAKQAAALDHVYQPPGFLSEAK